MAIEVLLPDSGRVEVTDTFRPGARPLNGLGDSVQAEVFWSSLDSDKIAVLDSATGISLAKIVGIGRLQARTGSLISNPQNVAIVPRLDSVQAAGATRGTVALPDSLSDSLGVQTFATGGAAVSRRVVFSATTFPASGPVVTFLPNDSVGTNASGLAVAQLRLLPGPLPDSVVVLANLIRFNGTAIAGSPVTFVVEFHP